MAARKHKRNSRKDKKVEVGVIDATVPFHEPMSPETKRFIGIIFLCAVGLIALLSIFGIAGSLGAWFSSFLGALFGAPKILAPILFFTGAYMVARSSSIPLKGIGVLGFVLFFFAFEAFWHIGYDVDDSLTAAFEGHGGGLIGFFLAYSLRASLGFWGGLVILFAIFLSSVLIIGNTWFSSLMNLGALTSLFHREGGEGDEEEEEDENDLEGIPETREEALEQGVRFAQKTLVPLITPPEAADSTMPTPPKPPKKRVQLSLDLLEQKVSKPQSIDVASYKTTIQKTLENFGIPVEMGEVNIGPTVTQFTLKPADGVKLASITGLHNDLALALAAHPIRIEAPIPGKALVGLEVPNQKTALVTMREMLAADDFKRRKNNMYFALGRDVGGAPRYASVSSMPHMLIAGSTGSGKTVCVNSLIISLLYQNGPEDLRFLMVDPKRVELPGYNDIPHLLSPVVTDVKKAVNVLKWAVAEMERRFETLAKKGKRDIASFNAEATPEEKLPFIVIIIDELADIMVTTGADVENLIIRLAQMARAVGIHLVLATQRPSVDVITGLIKANVTTRIAFAVASQMDSRTILDTPGAERLIGKGDMLFINSESSRPTRIQGVYVSDAEISRVVQFIRENSEPQYEEAVIASINGASNGDGFMGDDDDDMLPQAKEVVMQMGKASASLLQRRLRVGYARAARLIDLLEAQGIVGPADGARPRDILVKDLDDLDIVSGQRSIDSHTQDEETPYRNV